MKRTVLLAGSMVLNHYGLWYGSFVNFDRSSGKSKCAVVATGIPLHALHALASRACEGETSPLRFLQSHDAHERLLNQRG